MAEATRRLLDRVPDTTIFRGFHSQFRAAGAIPKDGKWYALVPT